MGHAPSMVRKLSVEYPLEDRILVRGLIHLLQAQDVFD